jgi:hypothetical protein
MDTATLRDLTAVCGIDCWNCEFYRTNIDGFFATMAPERRQAFAARGLSVEKLRCNGCRHGGCTMIAGECDTLACAKQHGVDLCADCADFPCVRLQPLADGAEKYPHNLKVYNLAAIKQRGLAAWAAETGQVRKAYFEGRFKIGAGPQLPAKG